MNTQLKLQRQVIGFEAYSVASVSDLLKRTFPSMVEGLSGFIGLFDKPEAAIQLTTKQSEMLKELPKHSYIDIADLTAWKPPGLDTNLLHYLEPLETGAHHVTAVIADLAPKYTMLISRLINQDDFQRDTRQIEQEFKGVEKTREDIVSDIGKNFKKGATDVKCTIGDVVQRNGDWKLVFEKLETVNTIINKIDRSQLSKAIKEIVELLETLKQKIERGGMDKVSPEIIRGISEGTYQLAATIEFYSVLHYRLLELSGTTNQTIENFLKSTKA